MVLKCLFLIGDNISVYRKKGNELIPIKFKGDIFYKGNILEIMNWFEDKSGYIEGESKFDICILKKEGIEIELDFSKYNFVEKTSWNKINISKFMMKKLSKSNIKYGDSSFKIVNNDKVAQGEDFVNFVLNLYPYKDEFLFDYTKSKTKINMNDELNLYEDKIEKEEGILAKYYRQKTLEISKM